jgi:hypothetical protein
MFRANAQLQLHVLAPTKNVTSAVRPVTLPATALNPVVLLPELDSEVVEADFKRVATAALAEVVQVDSNVTHVVDLDI